MVERAGTVAQNEVTPQQKAGLGAAVGVVLVGMTWVGEWLAGAGNPITTHTESVAVWVVDALPITLAVIGWASSPKRAVSVLVDLVPPPRRAATAPAHIVSGPSATPPPIPERLSHPDATPPALSPRRSPVVQTDTSCIPDGGGRVFLVVDGTMEGPAVASWLVDRGYRVVHVGDAASGSIARETEGPDLALVAGDVVGGAAMIAELGRHGVPLIVVAGRGMQIPKRAALTVRPISPSRIADALGQLAVTDEDINDA